MPARLLVQSLALVLAGTLLGAALNAASPRPLPALEPVHPASASAAAACTDPDGPARAPAPRMPLAEALAACGACTAGFVDARSAAVYARGHVPGAVHLPPVGDPAEAAAYEALRRFTTVVVYGDEASCDLPGGTVDRLRAGGFHDVRQLDGSWERWQDAGGPAQSGACESCDHAAAGAP